MEEDAQEMIDEVDEEGEVPRRSYKKQDKSDGTELVKEAVLDLDRELKRIRDEKNSLNSEIRKIDNIIKNAEEVGKKVERLRYERRIERLEAEETKLIEKKRKLQQKDESLNKRMGKVRGIKEKLSGV